MFSHALKSLTITLACRIKAKFSRLLVLRHFDIIIPLHFKNSEDPWELMFKWVRTINIYHIRNLNWENFKTQGYTSIHSISPQSNDILNTSCSFWKIPLYLCARMILEKKSYILAILIDIVFTLWIPKIVLSTPQGSLNHTSRTAALDHFSTLPLGDLIIFHDFMSISVLCAYDMCLYPTVLSTYIFQKWPKLTCIKQNLLPNLLSLSYLSQ